MVPVQTYPAVNSVSPSSTKPALMPSLLCPMSEVSCWRRILLQSPAHKSSKCKAGRAKEKKKRRQREHPGKLPFLRAQVRHTCPVSLGKDYRSCGLCCLFLNWWPIPAPPCLSCFKENGFITAHLLELSTFAVSAPTNLSCRTPVTGDSLLYPELLRTPNHVCHLKLQAALDCRP